MTDSSAGSSLDHAARKAEIRKRLLAARREAATSATGWQTTLVTLLRPGQLVAAYVPFGDEPGGSDLPAVLASALGPGGRLLLPVLQADLDLDWARYEGALLPGGRGPAEPAGRRLGLAAVAQASLVVVPAVAVDRRGVRLGRGGGSYDRALARVAPGARVVALLHDGELLDEDLPLEPHDRRVGAVITPGHGLVTLPALPSPG